MTKRDFFIKTMTSKKNMQNLAKSGNFRKYDDWLFEGMPTEIHLKRLYEEDTISNIKRDRKWYWLKMQGWSYLDIAKFSAKRRLELSFLRNTVIKGIGAYKKFLGMET